MLGFLQIIDSCTQDNLSYNNVRCDCQGEEGSAREQIRAFQRAGEQ